MTMTMEGVERSEAARARPARRADAAAIAHIYNQGIEDRVATFETELRSSADIDAWFDSDRTMVVVEETDRIVAFATAFPYRSRACYVGVREFSVYVERRARGRGYGRAALQALIGATRARGDWKLLSRVFPENVASRKLLAALGFREVGTYRRHAKLDGRWRDVIIVELLIDESQR